MFPGIDPYFAINVHFTIPVLYNALVHALGNKCISGITDRELL